MPLKVALKRTVGGEGKVNSSPLRGGRAYSDNNGNTRSNINSTGTKGSSSLPPLVATAAQCYAGAVLTSALILSGRRRMREEREGFQSAADGEGDAVGDAAPAGFDAVRASYGPMVGLFAIQRVGRGALGRGVVSKAQHDQYCADKGIRLDGSPSCCSPRDDGGDDDGGAASIRSPRAALTFAADSSAGCVGVGKNGRMCRSQGCGPDAPVRVEGGCQTEPRGRGVPPPSQCLQREGEGEGYSPSRGSEHATQPSLSGTAHATAQGEGRVSARRLAQLRRQQEVAKSFPDSPYRVPAGDVPRKGTINNGRSNSSSAAVAGGGGRGARSLHLSVQAARDMRQQRATGDKAMGDEQQLHDGAVGERRRQLLALEEEGRAFVVSMQRSAFEALYYRGARDRGAIEALAAEQSYAVAKARTEALREAGRRAASQSNRRTTFGTAFPSPQRSPQKGSARAPSAAAAVSSPSTGERKPLPVLRK